MSRALNAALVVGVIAAFGYRAPGSNGETEQSAAPKADESKRVVPDTSTLAFAGGRRLLIATCGTDWHVAINDKSCGTGLRVLIVSAPDPYESRLDWSYDYELEAVRRAVEASGYVIDRFDLPGPSDSVMVQRAHFLPAGKKVPRRALDPGVILFRPTAWREQPLLLVYVVGEVPTYGIHKDALRRALQEREELLTWTRAQMRKGRPPAQPSADPILIAAPTFSGSVPSLGLALKDVAQPILMISGSATDTANQRLLIAANKNIRYFTTINSDGALDSVLNAYVLPRLLRRGDAVAVLCDCSTVYRARGSNVKVDASQHRVITIPFPLNIAGFRAHYQKPKVAPDPKTAPIATPNDRVNLDLNKLNRAEETPLAISEATPATVDLVMREILSTLRRNSVRAVVIHATDVRDKLFLAQVIRQELKDVRLITYESNVLFQRDEFNDALRGMIVLSSYPLVLENQDWTNGGRDDRMAFPSETAQGTYNAVAMLLRRPDIAFEYGEPMPDRDGPRAPPVWVTVIGAHSVLPVATIPKSSASAATVITVPMQMERHEVSFAWAVVLLAMLCIFAYVSIATIRTARATARRQNAKCRNAVSRETAPLVYLDLHAFLGLVAVLALIAPVTVLVIRYSTTILGPILLVAVVVALSFWLAAFVWTTVALLKAENWRFRDLAHETFGYILRKTHYTGSWPWLEISARALLVLAGVGLLVAIALSVREILELTEANLRIFAYRALQVDSGVSPLLPIMLMAGGLYSWCAWHRGRVHDLREGTAFEEMLLELAEPKDEEWTARRGMAQVRDAVHQLRRRLVFVMPVRSAALAAVVLFIISVWVLYHNRGSLERLALTNGRLPFGSESVSFDVIFRGAIVSMLCVGSWAVLRLIVTWKALQTLLAGLAETPLAWSLTALPPAMCQRVKPTLITLPKSKRALGHIANTQWRDMTAASLTAGVEAREEETKLLEAVRGVPADETWWRPGCYSADMGEGLTAVHNALAEFWRDDPLRVAWNPKDNAARDMYFDFRLSPSLKRWRRRAEEFVTGQAVYYIEWAQSQMRRMSYFLLASLVISIALVGSYPFQPQSVVKALLAILIVVAMGSIIFITIQMNRDHVLSALADSDGGVLNWNTDLLLNILLYAVIPTLTLLSSEFPVVRDVVFAWAEPLIKSLAKF